MLHHTKVDKTGDGRYWRICKEATKDGTIRVEEVYHAITQIGYGRAYPKIFATGNGWSGTSTLVKECKKARCDWWQHPENNCTTTTPSLPRLSCMKSWASQKGTLYPGNGGTACSASQAKATCDYSSCDCIEWYHQVTLKIFHSGSAFLDKR